MKLKTLKGISLTNKLVLLRIDINSPVVNGKIIDSPRIKEAAETIKFLQKKKARIAIIAHQGRKGDSDFTSLDQHAKLLSKKTKTKINYHDDLFSIDIPIEIKCIKPGEAIILKNVREFDDENDINNPDNNYIHLCKNFDIYINDAFSVSHRAQGSIVIPPKIIPSFIGPSFEKELEILSKFDINSKGKSIFLIGGSKVEDYLPLFTVLSNTKNKVLASGVLANLLMVTKGVNLGYENNWLKEKGYNSLIPKLKALLLKYPNQIILPIDFASENNKKRVEINLSDLPTKNKIWDVGTKTTKLFLSEIKDAKTIFMKGPLGYSEIKIFSKPTVDILKEISKLTKAKKSFSLLGGGHLTTSIDEYNIPNNFSHISLSGGALIKYLSGETLPGIEALEKGIIKSENLEDHEVAPLDSEIDS